jgi:hypothetical protein
MSKVKIPINGKVYQNIDDVELTNISPYLMDGWVDEKGHTHRRPGLDLFVDLDSAAPIDGMYWDNNFGKLFAVSNGHVYSVTDAEGTNSDITGDALSAGTRPSFTSNGTYVVMANGGRMITYNNSGTTAYMADADAPDAVPFVAYLDQYILANHADEAKFYWSGVNAITWSALDFATAESRPDYLKAMGVIWREIYLFGSESIETWYNDGTTPFSRQDGGYTERGLLAPYSLKAIDNTWFFIDNEKRLVRLEGRTPKVISTPFDATLQSLQGMSSVKADHVTVGGKCLYVMQVPTANRTFAYDYKNDDWAEWGYWNSTTAEYEPWIGNCVEYAPSWNLHLVGSRKDGKIYKMSTSYYDDDGNIMRTARRTGYIDHDTLANKRCNSLTLKFKKGTGIASSTSTPYVMVKWRDNGDVRWSNEHWLSLGKVGETEFITTMKRLGVYRSRQYEFAVTDNVPLILIDAEADVDVLRG